MNGMTCVLARVRYLVFCVLPSINMMPREAFARVYSDTTTLG